MDAMKKVIFCLVLSALATAVPTVAAAGPKVAVEANTSFWVTLHEEAQNGQDQPGSDDEAAQTASGFNFKQGRVAFTFASTDGRVAVSAAGLLDREPKRLLQK